MTIVNVAAFIFLLLSLTFSNLHAEHDISGKKFREGKLISLFQVVKFSNAGCVGSGKNGTCYTAEECQNKGGVNSGSCAAGYGVCCTFSLSCNGFSRENCTYIESNSPSAGSCRHTICPCNDNICQLRLDFETFVIAGPSTNSMSEVTQLNGANSANGQGKSFASQCLTDTFSVTNTGGTTPAPICGVNTGQHMYVDVDRSRGGTGCNELNFQLGSSAVFTTIPTRQWSIKVSQIECDSPSRAPSGCTQYHFDPSGTVQTYNYDGGQHLAFQKQAICIRRGNGLCRICWTAIEPEDFAVSHEPKTNLPGQGQAFTGASRCCGFNQNGRHARGYDCVGIPGAMTSGAGRMPIPNERFCGRSVGLVKSGVRGNSVVMTGDTRGHITVCSTRTPFVINFISDGTEGANGGNGRDEISKPNKGFKLLYKQDTDNCS